MKNYESIKIDLQKFINKNPNLENGQVYDYFIKLGYNKRSLQRWVNAIRKKKSLKRKIGSGRKPKIATKTTIAKLKKMFNHRDGRSQRKAAAKLGCSHQYVGQMLKKHTKVKCFKKQKKTAMTDIQRKKSRPKCRKLAQKFGKLDFLIDDESYFTLSHSTLPGNDRFYSSDIQKTPPAVQYKYKSKYEKKLLVWVAISPRGMTNLYFMPSGLAINQKVYLDECMKKRLIPFIKKHYPSGGYVFWPDLASSHYAKSVVNFLKSQNVNLLPKELNPANVPKARPIEDFWGTLKMIVYEGGWTARTITHLKLRIRKCMKKLS